MLWLAISTSKCSAWPTAGQGGEHRPSCRVLPFLQPGARGWRAGSAMDGRNEVPQPVGTDEERNGLLHWETEGDRNVKASWNRILAREEVLLCCICSSYCSANNSVTAETQQAVKCPEQLRAEQKWHLDWAGALGPSTWRCTDKCL